jgi:hypothetical protein
VNAQGTGGVIELLQAGALYGEYQKELSLKMLLATDLAQTRAGFWKQRGGASKYNWCMEKGTRAGEQVSKEQGAGSKWQVSK